MSNIATIHGEAIEQGERLNAASFWGRVDSLALDKVDEALKLTQESAEEGVPLDWLQTTQDLLAVDLEVDREIMTPANIAAYEVAQLLFTIPDVAQAQARKDSFPRGQRSTPESRADKLALVNFNKHVKSVLAILPLELTSDFDAHLYAASVGILREDLAQPILEEGQLSKVVAGMEQEMHFLDAVKRELRAAKRQPNSERKGWSIRGATDREDTLGTDVVITDADNYELRIDVKAGSAFRRAVREAKARGTLTPQEAEEAMKSGTYYRRSRSSKNIPVNVCIMDMSRLRSDEDILGIIDRQFSEQRDQRLRKLGKGVMAPTHLTLVPTRAAEAPQSFDEQAEVIAPARERKRTRDGIPVSEWTEDDYVYLRPTSLAA